jgi:hypothetical protein
VGVDGPAGRDSGNGSGPRALRKLVFDGERLVGAVFAGRVDRAGVYRSFIETGAALGPTLRKSAEAGTLSFADVQVRGRIPAAGNFLRA